MQTDIDNGPGGDDPHTLNDHFLPADLRQRQDALLCCVVVAVTIEADEVFKTIQVESDGKAEGLFSSCHTFWIAKQIRVEHRRSQEGGSSDQQRNPHQEASKSPSSDCNEED